MKTDIAISELMDLGSVNIIDVRNIEKYNSNHVPGSINIPFNTLISEHGKYLKMDQLYYIYCQKGLQSARACLILRNNGYNAINVIGGYEAWILEDK